MIKVEKMEAPAFLNSETVDLAIEKLEEFYSSANRSQKRYDFPFNNKIDKQLKEYLHEIFHGKCGYCETKIESPNVGTVDRYRPHNGVRDKNEYNQDLYWWLAFEWDNLIYCCKTCNQYKANYFPIAGQRALSEKDDLTEERSLLLNPYEDDPEDHFYYDHSGNIYSKTRKGEQTIELLRLNRTNLVEQRVSAKKEVIDMVEEVLQNGPKYTLGFQTLNYIYSLENSSMNFLSFRKWVLLEELETEPFLGQILRLADYKQDDDWFRHFEPTDEESSYIKEDITSNEFFPIEYVHIRNFKSIEHLKIEFKVNLDTKPWLFLLGENGAGKSSILQAIAVGLHADKDIIKPLINRLIKNGKQKAEIEIKERDSNNIIRTVLTRKEQTIEQTGNPATYIIGYGSLRLSVEEAENILEEDIQKISYENLFKPIKALNDITNWLKTTYKSNPDFFERIAYSIKRLLPHDFPDNELTVQNGEIMFKNSEKLFSELSDGFKSTIILAVDIMMKLSSAQSDMDKMSGVVLIDELGNQLHPRWQMRIVTQLRKVFPNINFIVSTHHPLCLRGAREGEILLLKEDIDKKVIAKKELPDPSSMRVDQILSSEFFGLNSLIDPEIEDQFNRYYKLLAQSEITPQEKEEIYALKDQLRNKQQLGATLREELMYSVIDKLLAQEIVYNKNLQSRTELKEETIRRVKEVWKNLNLYNND